MTLLTSASGAVAARLVPSLDDVIVYEVPWMKRLSSGRRAPMTSRWPSASGRGGLDCDGAIAGLEQYECGAPGFGSRRAGGRSLRLDQSATYALAGSLSGAFQDVPCRFCYKSVCPEGHHRCLRAVPPERVAAAVVDLLEETQPMTESMRQVVP